MNVQIRSQLGRDANGVLSTAAPWQIFNTDSRCPEQLRELCARALFSIDEGLAYLASTPLALTHEEANILFQNYDAVATLGILSHKVKCTRSIVGPMSDDAILQLAVCCPPFKHEAFDRGLRCWGLYNRRMIRCPRFLAYEQHFEFMLDALKHIRGAAPPPEGLCTYCAAAARCAARDIDKKILKAFLHKLISEQARPQPPSEEWRSWLL